MLSGLGQRPPSAIDWIWIGLNRRLSFLAYFIISQLLLVPVIYGFTRLDWHALFTSRRFNWLRGMP
jgi:hypothetical protein